MRNSRPTKLAGRSGGFLWGLVEAEEVSFGVLEGRGLPSGLAHALSDFSLGEGDDASGGFDFGAGVTQ